MADRDPEMQALVDEALPPVAKRYDVYRELDRGNDLGPLWWVGFGGCFIALVASSYNRWVGYAFLAYAVLFVVRYIARVLALKAGFARFVAFPSRIAFAVQGWPEVLEEELALAPGRWRLACEVAVELLPEADDEVISAAETMFIAAANAKFYAAGGTISGAARDLRETWVAQAHRLKGSADLDVIGEMMHFVHALDRIHRRVGGVRAVTLRAGGSVIGVSHPRKNHQAINV